jgi:hypothetical protein
MLFLPQHQHPALAVLVVMLLDLIQHHLLRQLQHQQLVHQHLEAVFQVLIHNQTRLGNRLVFHSVDLVLSLQMQLKRNQALVLSDHHLLQHKHPLHSVFRCSEERLDNHLVLVVSNQSLQKTKISIFIL